MQRSQVCQENVKWRPTWFLLELKRTTTHANNNITILTVSTTTIATLSVSLLDGLKCAQHSSLARKRKVKTDPAPVGAKKKTNDMCQRHKLLSYTYTFKSVILAQCVWKSFRMRQTPCEQFRCKPRPGFARITLKHHSCFSIMNRLCNVVWVHEVTLYMRVCCYVSIEWQWVCNACLSNCLSQIEC